MGRCDAVIHWGPLPAATWWPHLCEQPLYNLSEGLEAVSRKIFRDNWRGWDASFCFEPVPGGRTPKEACSEIRAFIEAYTSEDQLDMWDEAVEELWPELCEDFPEETPDVLMWLGCCCYEGPC
jgi:hypothetical protein